MTIAPPDHFWDAFSGKVLISGDELVFTAVGRAELGPRFADCAIDINGIRTLAQFKTAMRLCNRYAAEENNLDLEMAYGAPDTTPAEKELIAGVLGFTPPAPLNVNELAPLSEPEKEVLRGAGLRLVK